MCVHTLTTKGYFDVMYKLSVTTFLVYRWKLVEGPSTDEAQPFTRGRNTYPQEGEQPKGDLNNHLNNHSTLSGTLPFCISIVFCRHVQVFLTELHKDVHNLLEFGGGTL